jgi:hypothetical protein
MHCSMRLGDADCIAVRTRTSGAPASLRRLGRLRAHSRTRVASRGRRVRGSPRRGTVIHGQLGRKDQRLLTPYAFHSPPRVPIQPCRDMPASSGPRSPLRTPTQDLARIEPHPPAAACHRPSARSGEPAVSSCRSCGAFCILVSNQLSLRPRVSHFLRHGNHVKPSITTMWSSRGPWAPLTSEPSMSVVPRGAGSPAARAPAA